eukprot:CAMPEP_0116120162 /NCGR_PEP_ID=MMETSP0329-20121206/3032_1 /TAXON_ID=697910 /ORGANISM="Pseudo-nitzschia arenysensis, Strain B593" /LENGTH=110 /DNA_ID=CAMNT_0003613921 /DNA_START=110 /DNA_END=442 /DNA_ORIENTATION=-
MTTTTNTKPLDNNNSSSKNDVSPQQQQRRLKRKGPLTNTNTDMLCTDGSLLGLCMYRFNLWTGLYMMNPYERIVFHLVGWFSLTVSLVYVYVFWKGFAEGFREGMVSMNE